MKRLLVLLFVLAAHPVFAQTHYCDAPQPTTGSGLVGSTLTVQHCNDGKDSTGTVVITPNAFNIYDNGVSKPIVMTKGTTSTVSGKTVYTGSYVVPSAGLHTLQTTALSPGATSGTSVEGPKSISFALTGITPVPSAPTSLTAQ